MKKNSFFFIIFSFFSLFFASAALSAQTAEGYEKCETLKTFLQKNNVSYYEMPLMDAGRELFPYSLKVDFEPKKQDRGDLYFIISIDDAVKNHNLILDILNGIDELYTREAGVHFIFSYGDKIRNFQQTTVSGVKNLINMQEIDDKDGILCVSFNDRINAIIPGGGGKFSPAHLISLVSYAFFESRLFYVIQGGLLAPFYRKRLLKEDFATSTFLENSIPAAGVSIFIDGKSSGEYRKKITKFFESAASNFSGKNREWDRHSSALQIGTYSLIIPEKVTVTALITTILVTVFVLCFFTIFNRKAHKNFSRNILKAWFLIPGRVILTAGAFGIGQVLAWLIMKTVTTDPYIQISIKFFTGFAIISFAYLIILKLHLFQPASFFAYLLPVTTVFNIFFFSAYDISFFYVFTAEHLIIYLSRVMKRTGSLIAICFILGLPFIPYLFQLILCADPKKAHEFIFCSASTNLIVSLAFMPFEYTWLRLLLRLNAVWKRVEKKRRTFIRQNVIAISASVFIFTMILLLTAIFIPDEYKQTEQSYSTEIINDEFSSFISIKCDDYENFKNLQRTIHVNLYDSFENVRVSVYGSSENPVLYSEYAYVSDSETKTDSFLLPIFPPKNFDISFISDGTKKTSVRIEALKHIPGENKTVKITRILPLPEIYSGDSL